jgi:Leucine-rich repeat (LRR) protein
VTGLKIDSKVCKFFPKGLDKTFSELTLIHLQNSMLQELHKSDLEPFKNLVEVDFDRNKLKIIEFDLFARNLNLRYISISNNEIEEIEPATFSGLMQLSSLFMHGNKCGRSLNGVFNNRMEVMALVKRIEENGCISSER